MSKQQNKRVRRERDARNLERQVNEALDPPSEGQYCVVDKKTGQRYRGLNFKQAQAIWNSLEKAIILNDEHIRSPN